LNERAETEVIAFWVMGPTSRANNLLFDRALAVRDEAREKMGRGQNAFAFWEPQPEVAVQIRPPQPKQKEHHTVFFFCFE